ncbi:MAG: hypothetical protein F6K11_00655 [Leptolyngbya sp. SIO3F4]|nr:hypothetical protein [Leptolyngbya sp. SIO3F4]
MILLFCLSLWCAVVSTGALKLVLRDIRLGFVRGKRGYRLYRAAVPRSFWSGIMMGIVGAIFFYGVAAFLMLQAFSMGS